uniref:Uncharacterized protein n=1 Tax=Aplanochytrium stocchinoi TaxID=215587 RepID=A0A7S3V2I1_9STRA|mmetsp:Transcript_10785/g.13488  ORF Transcript_10785/g.13488 Transcript_10785/m.13488 type:complete len:339 (-) Transcript_10785:1186-2202(-)|eukprot:CAMPEP_0204833516 /NCGR_PEP_ID=MMETSP1346-20131115/17045_1 /ASSEMBLY_ACC=CAM_ASM_000771 /TAXON_ID=215587 /ORGANISM="Aplanochytrium stocchinoi, Strain GSBS06" /LENGTH=338 /DNA_ID=CAMNT_0051966111 /DNA_START=458 /DNA_END=1474 /DNA_ORIENTATION=+
MVFARRRRKNLSSDSENSTASNVSIKNKVDFLLGDDNDSNNTHSSSNMFGFSMRKSTSSASLLQFRKRNESCSSLGSSYSASNSSFSKWHHLDNPLFSTSVLLRPKSSERNNRRKTERIQRKNEKQLRKLRTKEQPEDNLSLLEKENSLKGNKLKKSKSRRFRRRRNQSITEQKSTELLDTLEEVVNDDETKNTYTLYTKSGEAAKVHFGHDYLSIDGNLILYEHVIYWGYTKSCLKVSYVENMSTTEQNRVDVALYPIENEQDRRLKNYKKTVRPRDLANVLQKKVATLFSELTGCSKDEAEDKTAKTASKREVYDVLDQVDESSEKCIAAGYTKDI